MTTAPGTNPKPYLDSRGTLPRRRSRRNISPPFARRAARATLRLAKGCFTFTACLWYLMVPKTSKYPLPARARVYPRLGIAPSFCTYHLHGISPRARARFPPPPPLWWRVYGVLEAASNKTHVRFLRRRIRRRGCVHFAADDIQFAAKERGELARPGVYLTPTVRTPS